MRGFGVVLGWLLLTLGALGQEPAEDRKPLEPPGFWPSQLKLSGETSLGPVHFRATVLGKDAGSLLLLTAAHCLAPKDAGRTLQVTQGVSTFKFRVRAVARNPAFGSAPVGTEIPGADNALVVLDRGSEDKAVSAWIEQLEPAQLAADPVPRPNGQMIGISTIDQFEKAHTVRAGNYSNPRWLEWGSAYRPIPGDSGSGVFTYQQREGGPPEPILIGVVTDRSLRGGGASIVSRSDGWLAPIFQPARPSQAVEEAANTEP